MRLPILLFFSLFCLSCVATQYPAESEGGFIYKGYDFRKYSDRDFLITTTEPSGNYSSKGIIQVTLNPEVKEITVSNYNSLSRNGSIIVLNETPYELIMVPFLDGTKKYYRVEITSTEDAIDEIVSTAISWEANAIFEFQVINETVIDNGLTKIVRTISGFAVNRLAQQVEIVDN